MTRQEEMTGGTIQQGPDMQALEHILARHDSDYMRRWVAAAQTFEAAGDLLEAAYAWGKIRNAFGRKCEEWKILERWRRHMAERALAAVPPRVYVKMKAPFYERLDLFPLPLPVPEHEAGPILQQNRWTFEGLLTSLRYHLLAAPQDRSVYASVIARLAYETALLEVAAGNPPEADRYFNLSLDYANGRPGTVISVAYGQMKAGNHEKALAEFETVKRLLKRYGYFVFDVWLHEANLSFLLGRDRKGLNGLRDYFTRAASLSNDVQKKAIEFAFDWEKTNNPAAGFVAAIRTLQKEASCETKRRDAQKTSKEG